MRTTATQRAARLLGQRGGTARLITMTAEARRAVASLGGQATKAMHAAKKKIAATQEKA